MQPQDQRNDVPQFLRRRTLVGFAGVVALLGLHRHLDNKAELVCYSLQC